MRFVLVVAAAALLFGCGTKDGGAPGAAPPAGDGYDAPPAPPEAPDGASKLLGGGDNDPGFPPDAHEFLTGPTLRGTVRKGEGLAPMKGFTVSEYGVDKDLTTGEDGVFVIGLANEALPAIHVRSDGYVPTIQISSDTSRLYFDGEYKIEVFEEADEKTVLQEDFGIAWSDKKGQLVVNLQPMGSPKGVEVDLEPPSDSWIYGKDDKTSKGNTLPKDDSFAGEVVYPSLEPGSYAITVKAPKGLDCSGPAEVPVVAGTYTRAYYFCIEEGKEPRTATSGPEDENKDAAGSTPEGADAEGAPPADDEKAPAADEPPPAAE